MAAAAVSSLWLILLLLVCNSNGQAQAAPTKMATVAATAMAVATTEQQHSSDATTAAIKTTRTTTVVAAVNGSDSTELPSAIKTLSHLEVVAPVVQLLELELTEAPPIHSETEQPIVISNTPAATTTTASSGSTLNLSVVELLPTEVLSRNSNTYLNVGNRKTLAATTATASSSTLNLNRLQEVQPTAQLPKLELTEATPINSNTDLPIVSSSTPAATKTIATSNTLNSNHMQEMQPVVELELTQASSTSSNTDLPLVSSNTPAAETATATASSNTLNLSRLQAVQPVVQLPKLELTEATPIKSNTDIPIVTSSTLAATTTSASSKTLSLNHMQAMESVVQLLDLEMTATPPLRNGHDGRKLTKKKQLQQQQFAISAATAATTTATVSSSSSSISLLPVPNGYLGPIFMNEQTFKVVHPLKKPQASNHQQQQQQQQQQDKDEEDSIELQLREGRIVEILAPTALLESSERPTSTTRTLAAAPLTQAVLSTTVFQVPEQLSSTTAAASAAAAEINVAASGSAVLAAPPRTESKISDIQIEVYDSTVDSIVASTNFRDNQGYYPLEFQPVLGTTRPPMMPSSPVVQERFTQYVIDRADVSTQPAAGGAVGQPEPAAIEIHINVSEAFGNESEDLEFSYRQPSPSRPNDEILVVEIIDNNSTENAEQLNPMFSYPDGSSDVAAARPPAVRPPTLQEADELFMPDTKGNLPRPPHPPPPPPIPRKPNIDRDSDTIFYISNTEVKVGESLPTVSSGSSEQQQQRKLQLENQFFPARYMTEQRDQHNPTPRYEEDILLSPLQNTADALKILRSPGGGGDGAPPLDVTYVGESVIEVEQQQAPPSTSQSLIQPDIIIQPALLPDLAIGVPVIGELPPQIELKEIDYMPGELMGQGQGIYENDIESNGLGQGSDPDVLESSIQYGGDLIDDGAGGGFDGVEGSYPFDSPAHRLQQQDVHRPLLSPNHAHPGYSHLHREQSPMAELLNATLQQRNESIVGSDLGAASAMATLHGSNQLPLERMGNATALSEDPLAEYENFLNLFAVTMGLVIVILPAALLTSMYCAVRYLLNKNAASNAASEDSEQGHGQGQDYNHELSSCSIASSPPISQFPESSFRSNSTMSRSMSLALASNVQRIEFQFEARSEIVTPTTLAGQQAATTFTEAAFVKTIPFSGSVTMMTLKDNHLIVVTEERTDISRNARETKMHTDKDGVFVVEVARGIDAKQMPDSPAAAAVGGVDITELPFDTNTKQAVLVERGLPPPSHEQVQIHAPPSDFANPLPVGLNGGITGNGLQLIEEQEEHLPDEEQPGGDDERMQALTGLSTSDLSSTSSNDSNKRYSYGNQELYVVEQAGYAGSSTLKLIASEATIELAKKLELERQLEEPPLPAPAAFGNEPNEAETETETKEKVEDKETEHETADPEQEKIMPEQEEQEPKQQQSNEMNLKQKQEQHKDMEPEQSNNMEPEQEQTKEIEPQLILEPENNYDSLMSLPAPPSTEEIKELNDFTLIESNQLDSLPPPPPPPPLADVQNCNGHNKKENQQQTEEKDKEDKTQIEPKNIILNGNGNLGKLSQPCVTISAHQIPPEINVGAAGADVGVAANGINQEPSTLTPPASPPASPTAAGSSLCGGSLSNGIHGVNQALAVDVNGS